LNLNNYQIAIDGPAASGKSTTAKGVAAKLGIQYLDTGAMYRSFTYHVLKCGIDPNDHVKVSRAIKDFDLSIDGEIIILSGSDISKSIRENSISICMAPVCANPAVRERMVELQRQIGVRQNTVIDGRDIGTIVFPKARFKYFMVADLEQRARRRQLDLKQRGENVDLTVLLQEIKLRDQADSERSVGPLKQAADARLLDTTSLNLTEQIELIISDVRVELGNAVD
jgi:CMP/dCMP kinase